MIQLSHLIIYPVKSAHGIALGEAQLTSRGLEHDRRFMVVDEQGVMITQRELPRLARLMPVIAGATLELFFDVKAHVEVPLRPSVGELRRVKVWDDTVDALDLGDEARDFLSRVLGVSASLVYMPETSVRPVDPTYAEATDQVSFADGFPYLLASEASLADVSLRAGVELPMSRFRPNLGITGAPAFAEDDWARVRIGSIAFDVKKPCTRCVITTTDQDTGARMGKEPLETLAQYRRWHGRPIFGQNLIARGEGRLRVGDAVVVDPVPALG